MHLWWIEILEGLAILFMLGVVMDLLEPDRIRFGNRIVRDLALGLAIALLSFVVMSLAYEISPGIYIDTRSILLFAAGLYFGLVPTLFAVGVCILMRVESGGAGMLPGIGLIALSAAIGLIGRRKFRERLNLVSFGWLLACNCLVHLIMAVLMVVAMRSSGVSTEKIFLDILWIIPIYILGGTFFCLFLSRRIAGRERRRKLAASEAEARKLSSAVEQSPASVVITSIDGTIEYVNEKFTQLTGYSREEAIGQNPSILRSGELPESFYVEMWQQLLAGQTWRGEFHNKRKDGSHFWELALIAPIFGPGGEIEKFVGVKEDITERKKLEMQLREATARAEVARLAKSNFLNMISHELMTPLNAILGPSEFLLENCRKSDEEMLQVINAGCQRLKRIFEDLLTISRGAPVGADGSSASLVDLHGFVSDFETRHQAVFASRGQTLLVAIDERLPKTVLLSEAPVRRAVDLLLENAAKHAVPGEIWLRVQPTKEEGGISFCILDEGPGLPEVIDQALNQVFVQGDMTTTRPVDGLGLGLAVCQTLALSMGGRVRAYPRSIGGSEFVFSVPM